MPPPPPEGSQWPVPRVGLAYGASSQRPDYDFQRLLRQAVAEIGAKGYVSPDLIDSWIQRLRAAAERELGPEAAIDLQVRDALGAVFRKLVERGAVADRVPGVTRFGLSLVQPRLRAELDRRILASADLIRLRRKEAVERTLARFQGWATSIPPGGAGAIDKREVRSDIGKSVAQFRFERRRVDVDQGHKLIANVTDIVARDAGAIAGVWHDHGEHDTRYNARKEHMGRAGKCYAIKDSWAMREGLITKGAGYLGDMTAPGQEPFCRCFVTYIISPRRVPEEMLTAKGREWVERGRMEGMRAA